MTLTDGAGCLSICTQTCPPGLCSRYRSALAGTMLDVNQTLLRKFLAPAVDFTGLIRQRAAAVRPLLAFIQSWSYSSGPAACSPAAGALFMLSKPTHPARARPLRAGLCSRSAPLRPIRCCAVPCAFGRPMAAKFLPPSLRTGSAEVHSRTGVSCGVLSLLFLIPGGTSLAWAGSRIRPAGLVNLRNLTAVTLG